MLILTAACVHIVALPSTGAAQCLDILAGGCSSAGGCLLYTRSMLLLKPLLLLLLLLLSMLLLVLLPMLLLTCKVHWRCSICC